jgi:hypothetical protein
MFRGEAVPERQVLLNKNIYKETMQDEVLKSKEIVRIFQKSLDKENGKSYIV